MARILTAEVSGFCTNSFVVVGEGGTEAALIDPGDDPEIIEKMITDSGAVVKRMIATHCHLDHIGAAAEMGRRLDLPLLAGGDDAFLLDTLEKSCAMYGLAAIEKPAVTEPLEEGMEIALGGSLLRFHKAPGHSPGSFVIDVDGTDLIVGDVLFQGSVGRTDLPGGDTKTLMESIRDVILPRDDGVTVHCGHGPATTVGRERRSNYFLIEWGLSR